MSVGKVNVIIDIDGVLADYRKGLLEWIRRYYPELSDKCNHHLARTDTWINEETMGVSYRRWLEILEYFRMSGGKQFIPAFPYASELTTFLRNYGFQIILLTSRPIDIYSTIYRDTVEWLRFNGIEYDLLLWAKNKAEMVVRLRLIDNTVFAIDDELGHIQKYASLGVTTYWIDHYDKGAPGFEKCKQVNNLRDILEDMNNACETAVNNKRPRTNHSEGLGSSEVKPTSGTY